jgi:hypothetical protein
LIVAGLQRRLAATSHEIRTVHRVSADAICGKAFFAFG